MEIQELLTLSKKIIQKLPLEARKKLEKTKLCRGGDGGIYNKRRKRWDVSIITFDSYLLNHEKSSQVCQKKYPEGFYILVSPEVYEHNIKLLQEVPTLVEYSSYEEIDKFKLDITKIKNNLKDYNKFEPIFVANIKDLDKHKNKGGTIYIGPKNIGQNEMDYATKEECEKVNLVLLYEYIKMFDFESVINNDFVYKNCLNFAEVFEKSTLFLENEKLRELTEDSTRCAFFKKIKLKFSDVLKGEIEADLGRKKFNRTVTKINLHHIERLIAGRFNHNHKNVFFGTSMGNMIDAALNSHGYTIQDLKLLL